MAFLNRAAASYVAQILALAKKPGSPSDCRSTHDGTAEDRISRFLKTEIFADSVFGMKVERVDTPAQMRMKKIRETG
jgi:hypothetical protein